jgi:hypothetical protein
MKKSVFKLTVFYTQKEVEDVIPYPVFEVSSQELGLFSSLQLAEAALPQYISEAEQYGDVYCFFIKEYATDVLSYSMIESERVYSPTGELIDECLLSELECEAFYGRPAEKIRFKEGDIVEILQDDHVELGVIFALPLSIETVQKKNLCSCDSSDDCYGIYYCAPLEQENIEKFDLHDHVPCCYVFAPRFPIPENLKLRMKEIIQ